MSTDELLTLGVFALISINIALYIQGIRLAKAFKQHAPEIFESAGQPTFYYFGIAEYRLLLRFVIFQNYAGNHIPSCLQSSIRGYKHVLGLNVTSVVVFIILLQVY